MLSWTCFNAPEWRSSYPRNLYIAETNRLRRVSVEDGTIRTVAGNGDGINAQTAAAEIAATAGPVDPSFITVDAAGRVVMNEYAPYLRVYDLVAGRVRLLAGNGVRGSAGDGGLATAASITPTTVRADGSGNIYFTEFETGLVRVLRPVQLTGVQAVSGADQSAAAGASPAAPLVVRVVTATGPIGGASVTFTATNGATLNPATALTDREGLARTTVTFGATPGPVTVTATVAGLPPVTFRLTATEASGGGGATNRPAIRATGGLATASAFGGQSLISPGTWMEIYGSNLATSTRSWAGDDFRGPQAPTELDGVRVTIGGQPAYVAFISPGQINVQVPDGIGTGPVNVIVTNAAGSSGPIAITAAAASPGLLAPPVFRVDGVQYVAALHQDGVFAGRENLIAGAAFRPARAGDVLTLYGVGFGATNPAVPAGQVVGAAAPLTDVRIRIGDRDATVLFGGLASSAVGLYQINLVVPAGVAAGDATLSVTSAGRALPQELRLTVAQ